MLEVAVLLPFLFPPARFLLPGLFVPLTLNSDTPSFCLCYLPPRFLSFFSAVTTICKHRFCVLPFYYPFLFIKMELLFTSIVPSPAQFASPGVMGLCVLRFVQGCLVYDVNQKKSKWVPAEATGGVECACSPHVCVGFLWALWCLLTSQWMCPERAVGLGSARGLSVAGGRLRIRACGGGWLVRGGSSQRHRCWT